MGLRVTGIDSSQDMVGYAGHAFPTRSSVHSPRTPLADGSVAGYRAERVYSHIKDPRPALAEARRVLAPNGRFVMADVESDLWAIDSDDRAMTRAMVRAFADAVANPWIGRAARPLLLDSGFADVCVDFHAVIITTFFPLLIEQCAKAVVASGVAGQQQADSWVAEQHDRGAQDRFFAAVPFYIVSARRQ
jgi:SAM-dependent methyltransferase